MKIGIVGLGYVGLPLARLFATKYSTVGYDTNSRRVEEIWQKKDRNLELSQEELQEILIDKEQWLEGKVGLFCTDKIESIENCDVYVVTVPTPVDLNNTPNLTPLSQATEQIAKVIKKGNIVIYESTVYPLCTREICIPILEKESGLKLNEDFGVGYSPERINPADKIHKVENIRKITSGSDEKTAKAVDNLYKSVLKAETYLAPSIEVAEAAKVVENTQRDVNIAFMNELSKMFSAMGIETRDVIQAAQTKWNFLNFTPGLVGGHCTGVDPYYLAQKSLQMGVFPEIILSSRRTNNSMGKFVAEEVIKLMIDKEITIKKSNVLVLGITFKENCPDIRNTKIVDVVRRLEHYGCCVSVYDPYADKNEVREELEIILASSLEEREYDAIVLAVGHREFLDLDYSKISKKVSVIYDVKSVLKVADKRL